MTTTTLQLTSAQRLVLDLQRFDEQTLLGVSAAMCPLIHGYERVWNLPDPELRDVLQLLHDTPAPEGAQFANELERLLYRHYVAGTTLNAILDAGGFVGRLAQTAKPREWVITEGRVELVPLPEPVPSPVEDPPQEPPQEPSVDPADGPV